MTSVMMNWKSYFASVKVARVSRCIHEALQWRNCSPCLSTLEFHPGTRVLPCACSNGDDDVVWDCIMIIRKYIHEYVTMTYPIYEIHTYIWSWTRLHWCVHIAHVTTAVTVYQNICVYCALGTRNESTSSQKTKRMAWGAPTSHKRVISLKEGFIHPNKYWFLFRKHMFGNFLKLSGILGNPKKILTLKYKHIYISCFL